MTASKELLITVATHGDEGFSIPVVRRLANKYGIDWRVNNPRALAKNKRYVETDMNRSGPGSRSSKSYEERRAQMNIKFTEAYGRVIDIHGSTSNCGVFLILSDPNWQNIELAKSLDVANVVLWPSLQPIGPLTQFIPNSLEIECGPMDKAQVKQELNRVLEKFIQGRPRKVSQTFYIVTGCLKGEVRKKMMDFVETKYLGKSFIPLLVDQYKGIKCYMLTKLGDTLLNSE